MNVHDIGHSKVSQNRGAPKALRDLQDMQGLWEDCGESLRRV